MIIIILITIIIIIFFFYINTKINYSEHFTQNILFINNNDLLQILQDDSDNYYKSFFKNDFTARNINNINDYINLIKLSTSEYNNDERNKITKCINEINDIFNNINNINKEFKWFDSKKANGIPWKIGCIKGKLYENGLPHTRNDIIIISKDNINDFSHEKLLKTLIHEKVHVYQKLYPDDVKIYIDNNNFYKIKQKEEHDNIRSNPDLDNWIYKDDKNNIYKAIYNENPSSIEDIVYSPVNNQSHEHPFEKMAIEIENDI